MEGIIKWGLIGLAAYVVGREMGLIGGSGGPLALPAGNQSSGGVSTTTTTQVSHKDALITLASQDGTYKANNGKLGYDQWNYFLMKLVPSPIISWEDTPAKNQDRGYLWTVDEFWGFVTGKGITGLGMLREPTMLKNIRTGGGANFWERAWMN